MQLFENSALKDLLVYGRDVSLKVQEQIKQAIRKNQKKISRTILGGFQVFLLPSDIETILTSKDTNLILLEQALRQLNVISNATQSPCSRELLIKKLHEIGHNAEKLIKIVDVLDDASGLSRTDLNSVASEIIKIIQ